MSQPLDNILKAINDHAEPRTETRRLPNWFTLVYMEDYREGNEPDGGRSSFEPDPSAGTKDRDSQENVPPKNKKGGG